MNPYVLFGAPGWGSVLTEAMLVLCKAPWRFENVDGFDHPGPARDRLLALNPTAQVPALILPNGEVMSESAAIALLLAETFPAAGLAPDPGSEDRARFLRRLVWLVASVYATFSYADYPERWTGEGQEAFRQRVIDYRKRLWLSFEMDLGDGPWVLGLKFSALDIYVSVMTRWRPGRDWFAAACPKLEAIARRVDDLPALRDVWTRNFEG